jgi:hypothetical protein
MENEEGNLTAAMVSLIPARIWMGAKDTGQCRIARYTASEERR